MREHAGLAWCVEAIERPRFLRVQQPVFDKPLGRIFERRNVLDRPPVAVQLVRVQEVERRLDRRRMSVVRVVDGWSDYDITLEAFQHLRMFIPNYIKNRRLIQLHLGRPLLRDVARALRRSSSDRTWLRERVLDPAPSASKVRISVTEFGRMFPSAKLEIQRTWAGYEEATPDAVP
jgi:hypothetical protein